jgi:hypothetical protein
VMPQNEGTAMTIDRFPMPIVQSCWVVPDIDQATKGWISLGVGPFFRFDVDIPNALYRGKVSPLAFTVALAQAGPTQIEFICQRSDGPSAYRDTVPSGSSGFHHVCRAFGGYDETVAKLKSQGVMLATEFEIGGARTCYADTRATMGCMLEVVDDSDIARRLLTTLRDGAIGWDGHDPIREFTLL